MGPKGGRDVGWRGVRIADTHEQADRFFLELTQPPTAINVLMKFIMNRDRGRLWNLRHVPKPTVIVQSHIYGRPANCAVVCWEGRVLAGIGVEVLSAEGLKGQPRLYVSSTSTR